jgi:hypothetical protein
MIPVKKAPSPSCLILNTFSKSFLADLGSFSNISLYKSISEKIINGNKDGTTERIDILIPEFTSKSISLR